ncbi:S-layer family protein, partial [Chitinophaga sp. Cy-1792]|uniref:beta strand repeat-containing protein n=1 Tax=Chitinophaga sp. Cy-1792 TaxID=2608339 RepID=UPI00141EC4A2
MKKYLLFIMLFCGVVSQVMAATPDANGILYVKKGATGTGDSWSNAIGEVADALNAADLINAANAGTVKQIWVSGGIYYPAYLPGTITGTSGTRDYSFPIIKNVEVYGGFAGNETALSQRNLGLVENTSILSGDYGIKGNYTDNFYHVVVSLGNVGSAALNGFTIIAGSANATSTLGIKNNNGYSGAINRNYGAGIYCSTSNPKLQNLYIRGNMASFFGAGIYADQSPVIINTVIAGNYGDEGAGIYCAGISSPSVINSAICSNYCTINSSTGAGICITVNATCIIRNTVITGNRNSSSAVSNIRKYNTGSSFDIKNSFIEGATADAANGILGGTTDPMLVNPVIPSITTSVNNGGVYRLKAGSPLINAGSNSFFTDPGPAVDLAGSTRMEGTIDIGPYEYTTSTTAPSILYVKKGSNGDGSSWSNAMGEVADALRAANLNTQTSEIWVAGGNYNPKYNVSDLDPDGVFPSEACFTILKNIKIYGGFAGTESSLAERNLKLTENKTVLNGDLGSSVRANHIIMLVNPGTTILDGLTITNAYASQSGTYTMNGYTINKYHGGGIAQYSGTLNLSNMDIYSNALNTSFGSGGGIFSTTAGTTLTINNSRISGNQANQGGGIYTINTATTATLKNVLISGNYSYSSGCGISIASGSLTLINNTISGNYSNSGGAAINATGTSTFLVNVYNSIIYNNNNAEISTVGPTLTYQYSLIKGKGVTANSPLNGNVATPDFVSPLAPGLAPNAGGDYRLKVSSVAVNAGNNSLFTGLDANSTDLAGNARVLDYASNGIIDLGAYEYSPELPAQTINPISDVTKVYGDAPFDPGATATSNLTVTYTSSDNSIATAYLDAADSKWKIKLLKAGTVTITANQAGDASNAAATPVPFTLTINKAALTVTAKDLTMGYNGLPFSGGNGVTMSGFVNSETETAVTGTPTYSGNAQSATNVGSYTITPGGLSTDNYTITYADGALTINPAAIIVTANAATKTYNGLPYIGGNGVTITGLVNNESNTVVTGTPVYTGNAQNATNAGTYTITPSGLTAANYTITYADGALTINPAAITVTANAATKTYNGLPYIGGNGVTIAGLVNNESNTVVTGTPVYSGNAQNATNAGTYTITPSGLTAANYTITYADGALTINPAAITV